MSQVNLSLKLNKEPIVKGLMGTISESLYIKKLCPTLNSDISSVPLYIA